MEQKLSSGGTADDHPALAIAPGRESVGSRSSLIAISLMV